MRCKLIIGYQILWQNHCLYLLQTIRHVWRFGPEIYKGVGEIGSLRELPPASGPLEAV